MVNTTKENIENEIMTEQEIKERIDEIRKEIYSIDNEPDLELKGFLKKRFQLLLDIYDEELEDQEDLKRFIDTTEDSLVNNYEEVYGLFLGRKKVSFGINLFKKKEEMLGSIYFIEGIEELYDKLINTYRKDLEKQKELYLEIRKIFEDRIEDAKRYSYYKEKCIEEIDEEINWINLKLI